MNNDYIYVETNDEYIMIEGLSDNVDYVYGLVSNEGVIYD